MSPDEIRAIPYRVYDAINVQDLATLETLFDPQIVRHAMGQVGFEDAKNAVINAFKDNPNRRFVIEDAIAEGNKAAVRVTVESLPDHQPELIIMEIFRIENGRVAEIWGAGMAVKRS